MKVALTLALSLITEVGLKGRTFNLTLSRCAAPAAGSGGGLELLVIGESLLI